VTKEQNLVIRVLMIAAMTVIVLLLMHLTSASQSNAQHQQDDHATLPASRIVVQTKEQRLIAMADAWTGDISFGAPYSALAPLSSLESAKTDARFDPADDYWGLPRSQGVETVSGYCSACHSLAIVMQQRQTEEDWDYLLNWMVEKQGMALPPDDIRAEIIAYLSREFGPP
jgi:hypothetical protein